MDIAPPVPSGEELYDMVSQYESIVFGFHSGKNKFPCFGVTDNWLKKIFFWGFLIERLISYAIIWMSCIYIKKTLLKIFLPW